MKKVDEREKLIALIEQGRDKGNEMCGKQYGCDECQYKAPKACVWGFIADHLIANGVTLNVRDCHWATECAYKNGYKQGYEDGLRDRKRKEETKSSGISQRTVRALERMGQKVHGGEDEG